MQSEPVSVTLLVEFQKHLFHGVTTIMIDFLKRRTNIMTIIIHTYFVWLQLQKSEYSKEANIIIG